MHKHSINYRYITINAYILLLQRLSLHIGVDDSRCNLLYLYFALYYTFSVEYLPTQKGIAIHFSDYLIISAFWYRYIGVLVPTAMMPCRGLLAPLAAPLPSVFFMELRLRRYLNNCRYHRCATSGTSMRYRRYHYSAIIRLFCKKTYIYGYFK